MSPDTSITEKTQIPLFPAISMMFAVGSVLIAWGQLGTKIDHAAQQAAQLSIETSELRRVVVELRATVAYQQARIESCVKNVKGDDR